MTPTAPVEITIVVCSFNGAARLRRFLPQLNIECLRADCIVELLVVDDGSTDGTGAVAAALVAEATVVGTARNRGLPAARNLGADAASAQWLLYCDDDVVLSAEAISELWRRRRVGTCLVPVVTGTDGEIQNSVTLEWALGDPKFRFHMEPVAAPAFPVGSCFLVSLDDYRRAGGCDERFFPMYYDDAALGADLLRTGTNITMASDVVVKHFQHGGEPSAARLAFIQPWIYRNRWNYVLFSLRGRQRALALSLGLPRVVLESIRSRSTRPLTAYASTVGRAPRLFRTGARTDRGPQIACIQRDG